MDGDEGRRIGWREGDKEQEEKSGEQCETRGRGEEKSSWARSTKRSTLLVRRCVRALRRAGRRTPGSAEEARSCMVGVRRASPPPDAGLTHCSRAAWARRGRRWRSKGGGARFISFLVLRHVQKREAWQSSREPVSERSSPFGRRSRAFALLLRTQRRRRRKEGGRRRRSEGVAEDDGGSMGWMRQEEEEAAEEEEEADGTQGALLMSPFIWDSQRVRGVEVIAQRRERVTGCDLAWERRGRGR